MFITLWLIFMFIGLSMAVSVFIWSVKAGQFNNPKRASALPITEGDIKLATNARFIWRKEIIALLIIVILCLISIGITLILAL